MRTMHGPIVRPEWPQSPARLTELLECRYRLPAGSKSRLSFFVAAQDAKLVSFGISEHHPPCAVRVSSVVDALGSELANSIDFSVAPSIGRGEIEVNSVLDCLRVGYLNKQHPMTRQRINDHAFLVTNFVGIVGQVGVPQNFLPPPTQRVRIQAINAHVRDSRRHASKCRNARSAGAGLRWLGPGGGW
jgi:hypothetical protein